MLDDLTTQDQRVMFAVVTLVHLADSKEELDSNTDAFRPPSGSTCASLPP